MEHEFWHNKWQANEIGFHKDEANTFLKRNLSSLGLNPNAKIFVPLCGKTLDIAYLLSCGHEVVAIELNESAVLQLFDEMNATPNVIDLGDLKQYQAPNVTVYVGDIFKLTKDKLGAVDAVYDRAALVALPDAMRQRYAKLVSELTDTAPQLLVAIEYDQSQHNGPPFSISETMVHEIYSDKYERNLLERVSMEGGLKGKCEAWEAVWLLK